MLYLTGSLYDINLACKQGEASNINTNIETYFNFFKLSEKVVRLKISIKQQLHNSSSA